jgi:hypothetical protein
LEFGQRDPSRNGEQNVSDRPPQADSTPATHVRYT